jgi:Mn2+/Fe2+ NRAMP family transporter
VFVSIITAMIAISAFVAIIPGVPVISLLIGVQVVNGLLLPVNLYFMWRLSRSANVMGERRTRPLLDLAMGATVLVFSALSLAVVVVTLASP